MDKQRPEEPGSFIGNVPEASQDTIPGGVQRADERIAGTATQSSGEGAADHRVPQRGEPGGHRQGERASDDQVREAGENR